MGEKLAADCLIHQWTLLLSYKADLPTEDEGLKFCFNSKHDQEIKEWLTKGYDQKWNNTATQHNWECTAIIHKSESEEL